MKNLNKTAKKTSRHAPACSSASGHQVSSFRQKCLKQEVLHLSSGDLPSLSAPPPQEGWAPQENPLMSAEDGGRTGISFLFLRTFWLQNWSFFFDNLEESESEICQKPPKSE